MSRGYNFNLSDGADKSVLPLLMPKKFGISPLGIRNFKAKVVVKKGSIVKKGQELFFDKNNPKIKFVSPVYGSVENILYGKRKVLKTVIISRLSDNESVSFFPANENPLHFSKDIVKNVLLESGLWASLRSFPGYSLIPDDKEIKSFYLSMHNTEPHSTDSEIILKGNEKYLKMGLLMLKKLSSSIKIFNDKADLKSKDYSYYQIDEKKYPSHNIGLQVFQTDPKNRMDLNASVGLESVINIGYLFDTGSLRLERIYSVSGDALSKKTHYLGYSCMAVKDILASEIQINEESDIRFISGGLLTGDQISYNSYISPFDNSLQVMSEDRERTTLAFLRLGNDKLSLSRTYASGFYRVSKEYRATTSNHGEGRACVQCGYCIDFCPVELFPNMLMKAALLRDTEKMESLFIHDCVECGLCTFVCPSKIEIMKLVQDGKLLIEKEG
jgi:Na+-transporting NADH:ubiquinone oxidoreductase subunit A